jgi:hypothetical protein
MPQVIVIDEIGTELEAAAARTIAERGVQLIGTAHGNNLDNLMLNPTLSDLIGGIQSVTLGDEEARRRRTQKSVLERKAPPTFDVVVEIQNWNRVAVHENVSDVIDAILRGHARPAILRYRDDRGEIHMERPPTRRGGPPHLAVAEDGPVSPTPFSRGRVHDLDVDAPRFVREPSSTTGSGGVTRVYAYGVNRSRTEQVIRAMHLPIVMTEDALDADVVLTLKNYYRRKPQPLRDAESNGTPIYVLRGNSGSQIEEGLGRIAQMDRATTSATTSALQETEDAISNVLEQSRPIELSPQTSYIRRLQHQLAERYNLGSRSLGREPYRRVQIFPRESS